MQVCEDFTVRPLKDAKAGSIVRLIGADSTNICVVARHLDDQTFVLVLGNSDPESAFGLFAQAPIDKCLDYGDRCRIELIPTAATLTRDNRIFDHRGVLEWYADKLLIHAKIANRMTSDSRVVFDLVTAEQHKDQLKYDGVFFDHWRIWQTDADRYRQGAAPLFERKPIALK